MERVTESVECLAVSQLCLWSQGREAGRGRQAGCSGSEPGHTLCHAAQEKPRSEGDRELGVGGETQIPPPPLPEALQQTPGVPLCPLLNHLTHLVPLSLVQTRPPWHGALAVG
ncbi:hypothetical protein VZT92_006846 [Zoarces viviparus]|uniref:Uncharacterized protein n=1 Tax=Zoarces viviparus TaxID=48416 RepID=A0AAW1FMG4_ZOAVI